MRDSTSWVVARLPADCSTNTRSSPAAQHVQLAERADVVDAGVGAGVGQEDESGVESHREAVGHGARLPAGAGPPRRDVRRRISAPRIPAIGRGGEDADLGLVLQRRIGRTRGR
jgi:hypothetical protein